MPQDHFTPCLASGALNEEKYMDAFILADGSTILEIDGDRYALNEIDLTEEESARLAALREQADQQQ